MDEKKDQDTTTEQDKVEEPGKSDQASDSKKEEGNAYKEELERIKKEAEAKDAELKKATKQLEQAEHVIEGLKKAPKKDESVKMSDDDVDAFKEELRNESRKEIENFRASLVSDVIEEEISRITQDPDARALLRHHYDNSIVKTGFGRAAIADDISKAWALANRKVIERATSEAEHSAAANSAASKSYAGSHQVKTDGVRLSPDEDAQIAAIARRTGQKIEDVRKVFLENKSKY